MPPAAMSLASPARMALSATITACKPEPQTLFTVCAAIDGGSPAFERRLPGRRLSDARLQHVAHDAVFDFVKRHAAAGEGFFERDGAKRGSGQRRQTAEIFADWRAGGGENDGLFHGLFLDRERLY